MYVSSNIIGYSSLWKRLCIAQLNKNKKQRRAMATKEVLDHAAGYWKWQYFRTVAECGTLNWKGQLGRISSRTGLPAKTAQVLR